MLQNSQIAITGKWHLLFRNKPGNLLWTSWLNYTN